MNDKDTDNSLFDTNKWSAFIVICLASFTLLLIKKTFIETNTAAFQILDSRGEIGLLNALSAFQYISVPFIYLFKFTVIAFIIWIGCFMFGYNVSYGNLWKIAVISEFIFLLPEIFKIIWFTSFNTDPTLYEVNSFYPFSLINIYDIYTLDKRYFYPLKALNIFEIIYWFVLVKGVHHISKKKESISYAIVFSSYVFFFLIWLGFFTIVYK